MSEKHHSLTSVQSVILVAKYKKKATHCVRFPLMVGSQLSLYAYK